MMCFVYHKNSFCLEKQRFQLVITKLHFVCASLTKHTLKVYGLGARFQVELFGFTFLVPSHAFLTPDNMLCDKPTPFVVMQINF